MNLSNFKILYARTEDRLILSVDIGDSRTVQCWLTRAFTRIWFSGLLRLQHQSYIASITHPSRRHQPPAQDHRGEPENPSAEPAASLSVRHMDSRTLSDLPIAANCEFENLGDVVRCEIELGNGGSLSLSLTHASWHEITRVIRQADILAQWDLASLMRSDAFDDAPSATEMDTGSALVSNGIAGPFH